jgi:glycosyltransferase involved in cell wall biosynthesis
MKISAIILTKGEPSTEKAVKSVDFADEIIVVLDDRSETKVKGGPNVKILKHELANDYSQQRNFGATQAKGDWLLYLDSDEILSEELQKEIASVVDGQSSADSYYLRRRDFFWGKELKFGETKTAREKGSIRLVKKNSGSWQGTVHEEFVSEHNASSLNGYIDHHPHQTIAEFLISVNEYSSLRAKELKNSGVHFSTIKMIFYPIGKFIYTYFIKLGFLDGASGFVYSFMMSFHSFLVRAKLLNL